MLNFLYSNIEGSGVTPENPFINGDPKDKDSWKNNGVFMNFDLHEFVDDPKDWDDANFGNEGLLYYPNKCADGSQKCKISFVLHGCYGQASSILNNNNGYLDIAYRNNLILVAPQTAGWLITNCWNSAHTGEPWKDLTNALTNKGLQPRAFLKMIERLS